MNIVIGLTEIFPFGKCTRYISKLFHDNWEIITSYPLVGHFWQGSSEGQWFIPFYSETRRYFSRTPTPRLLTDIQATQWTGLNLFRGEGPCMVGFKWPCFNLLGGSVLWGISEQVWTCLGTGYGVPVWGGGPGLGMGLGPEQGCPCMVGRGYIGTPPPLNSRNDWQTYRQD